MVEIRIEGDWVVVRVDGDSDATSAPGIAQVVEDVQKAEQRNLRFDLAAVEFMDSQGLNVLAQAHRRAKQRGRRIEVGNASEMIQTTLRLTGLGYLLDGDLAKSVERHEG